MQQWLGIGRLTKDVESRHTQSGKAVSSFTLAVDGDRKDQVDFINIVAWEKTAELCSQYLAKGRQVAVSGKWHSRQYENRDGIKVTVWEVTAERVKFLDKAEKGDSNASKSNVQPKPQPQRSYGDDPFASDPFSDDSAELDLDDLPF